MSCLELEYSRPKIETRIGRLFLGPDKVVDLSKRRQNCRLTIFECPSCSINPFLLHEFEHLIRSASSQAWNVSIDEEEDGNDRDQVSEDQVPWRPPPPHQGCDERWQNNEGSVEEGWRGAMSDLEDP